MVSQTSLLLSILPPSVLSLLLPHLDLPSLLRLEQTCHLLRDVVSLSGEYGRRCRVLGLDTESGDCKEKLILETRRTTSVTDHRVSQNLCYTRWDLLFCLDSIISISGWPDSSLSTYQTTGSLRISPMKNRIIISARPSTPLFSSENICFSRGSCGWPL